MASSGQVTLTTQSVDYPCCPYGRGHITLTNVIGWEVDDNANISFWQISSSTTQNFWGICYSTSPYYVHLKPQVSYDDGDTWVTLEDASHIVDSMCQDPPPYPSTYVNTITMSTTLINSLGSYHLNGNCQLRFLYYMDPTPAPSSANPNAFPNSSYSEASQVPIVVQVDWTATLKYDANGGTGAPADQTASVPEATTSKNFTVSSGNPTWGDFIFLGWSTVRHTGSCTEEDVEYRAGDTFTIQKSNPTITLYAVWMKDYRPGAILDSGNSWKSHNRSSGAASVYDGSTWKEMRTIDGASGSNNPPKINHDNGYKNMRKIGQN